MNNTICVYPELFKILTRHLWESLHLLPWLAVSWCKDRPHSTAPCQFVVACSTDCACIHNKQQNNNNKKKGAEVLGNIHGPLFHVNWYQRTLFSINFIAKKYSNCIVVITVMHRPNCIMAAIALVLTLTVWLSGMPTRF